MHNPKCNPPGDFLGILKCPSPVFLIIFILSLVKSKNFLSFFDIDSNSDIKSIDSME